MNQLQSALRTAFGQHAERPAVEGRALTLNFRELAAASNELAHFLQARGVRPGDMVPLLAGRSALLVLAEVALVRLGATYVPVDLASPETRQRAMLEAVGARLVLVDGSAALSDWAGTPPATVDLVGWWKRRNEQRSVGALPELWLASPAQTPVYVMFTSGTTGTPKGVMVPATGILRLTCSGPHFSFEPGQRWAFMASPAFDASTFEVWGPLLNGGCCVVQEEDMPGLDALGAFLTEQRITDAFFTSALFNAMAEDQLPSLADLNQLGAGGERVSPAHARRVMDAYPRLRLSNCYGPAEDTSITLGHRVTLGDTASPAGIPIGRPIGGTRVRIAAEDGSDADEGELWTSGDGLAFGYLNDPASTALKFVRHDGERWYRTGDHVRRNASGVIEFVGRVDRQIKLRGHRIELADVELALTRCHGVGDAAVVIAGERADERRMVAFVTALADTPIDVDALAREMRSRLTDVAVPGVFHVVAELPRTLNGKVDRRVLEGLSQGAARIAAAVSEGAASGFLADGTMGARLAGIFAARASHIAIDTESASLSYAELARQSELLAAHLVSLGLRAGDHLPLLLPRSAALVIGMLAAVRVGAVYAPIDLASPPARITRVLDVLAPRFALSDGPMPVDAPVGCHCIDMRALGQLPAEHAAVPWAATSLDAPLYVTFTSGSTGAPKGVVVPSRGLMRLLVDAEWAAFPADARWLLVTSPAFDIANLEIWGSLLHGACCVVQEGQLPSLDELANLIQGKEITHAQMSTALFNAMVDTQLPAMHGLQQFISGGERASPPHMRKFLLAHPHVRLINAYGPSETTVWSLSREVTLHDTHEAAGIPIGLPIPGTQVLIDAAEGGAPGELLIGGAGLAVGYLGDAEQTRAKFVEREGARWYRSGDLAAQREDGVFEYHGRADRQVKLQGQRIEIDEVELALAAFQGMGEVAVLLRGDDANTRHLAACYSGLAGAAPDQDLVTAYLSSRLPSAAVPSELLALERLPRNLNGKVDRNALVDLLDEARARQSDGIAAADAEPRGEFEIELARIWREVLPPQRITRDSHFMRCSGTSLLALHVAATVRKRLQRDLSPVDVLRHPVLADLARIVATMPLLAEDVRSHAAMPGVPVPLTRGQQSMLGASRLDPTGCAYLVHVAIKLPAEPDWTAVKAAFEQLALRHPALRLLAMHDGHQAHAALQPALTRGWWNKRPRIEKAPEDLFWPSTLLGVINRPFDTGTRGTMRVDAWSVADGGALVVWSMHHAVIDEASVDAALVELDALLRGRDLPPVYGSPFSFKSIESAWADPRSVEESARRFATAWAGAAPPLDRVPSPGKELGFELSWRTQQALRNSCDALGVTPFPILLTAYGLALQEVFGARFRFVQTPFSRRALPELVEPLSYLCDNYMIEAGARPAESPSEVLSRVAAAVLRGQAPVFHPMEDMARAAAAVDPQAPAGITQFGFTWRLDPTRSLPMAGQQATLIRVPQAGARNAMCLHGARIGDSVRYSIEAVTGAFDGGQVSAVARSFESHLFALCQLAGAPAAAQEPALAPSMPVLDTRMLRKAWSGRLGVVETSIGPASHFLRDGGSSLSAMRMAAELRRDCGFRLNVGEFLANPTFGRLATLYSEAVTSDAEGCVLVGPRDFTKVLLLIPGAAGHAAGLYGLAEELQKGLPAGSAVAIVDLDASLAGSPTDEPLWFVTRRIVQLVTDLGHSRVLGVVGFSLGGLLALNVAAELEHVLPMPIWMLDSFAPRVWRDSVWRRIERRIARMIRRPSGGVSIETMEYDAVKLAAPVLRASEAQWNTLGEQLVRFKPLLARTRVSLVQARQSAMRAGLLWQRHNNGFVPARFASWKVHQIEGDHLDLPRRLAFSTAQIILGEESFGGVPAH